MSSLETLEQVVAAGRKVDRRVQVHLKVDTGLGRNGSTAAEWQGLIDATKVRQTAGAVEVVGICKSPGQFHEPRSNVTQRQVAAFRQALEQAEAAGLQPRLRHLANSAGVPTSRHTLRHGALWYLAVRVSPGRHWGLRPPSD